MPLIKFIEFDDTLHIRGQTMGKQLANVDGSVGRDGVALPFRDKKTGEELEALVPWARIRQVVRAREPVKK